jgi:hypothetical protein
MSGFVGSQFTDSGIVGKPVLGTPASGTLTNATFPAGTVVQTVFKQNEAQSHETVGDGSTYTSSEMSLAITTTKLNSKIDILMLCFGTHCQSGTTADLWFQRAVSGGATSQLEQDKLISAHNNRGSGDTSNYEAHPLTYVDTTGYAVGTTLTYSVRYKRAAGSNAYYLVHTTYGVFCKIQEISV